MHIDSICWRRITLLLLICCFFMTLGCARQTLNLSGIEQGIQKPDNNLKHFEESSYSVYMLFDLIDVSPANIEDILAKANPDNKPVTNLQVTSRADFWAALVNILNGGVVDRGVIVSFNKVTIEGDIIQ